MKDNKRRLLNDDIIANKVQLITEDWRNLGEMSLAEAKVKANEAWLDLMQMDQKWDLVIVKLLDYWKFLYKQKKQKQKNKQQSKSPDLKTIKITFKISEHDLEVRKKQAEKFWKSGHPLKVVLILIWRENQYESIAKEKIEIFVNMLNWIYKVEKPTVKTWNSFITILQPIK